MSKADLVLLIIMALGAWGGYKEGFLMEVVSLVAIILGIFLGFKLMGVAMVFLEDRFDTNRTTLPYVAFIVVFIAVVLLVRLVGSLVKNSIDKSFLGAADQVLGASLGAFRSLFMVSVALWILDSLRMGPRGSWTEGSWLYPFTARLAPAIADWAGQFLPFFQEIFREF